MFRGSVVALVTPFSEDFSIDFDAYGRLIDFHLERGTHGIVPCGCTGEAATLAHDEQKGIIKFTVERVAGRVPVIAGTGSNNTADTVERTKRAQATGADAALVVGPSYNRPTPEGLFRHFATIADAVELPIVLYNVPTRTGVDMGNDVVARLREAHANIVAIKDAGGDVDRMTDLASRCDIVVLSGDDSLTWPLMALGAAGVISVLSNLTPSLMKSLVTAAAAGEVTSVLPLHRKVYDLAVGLGRFGPNPIPIKTAMALSGLVREEFRLPLCPVDKSARSGIEAILRRHELLERTNS